MTPKAQQQLIGTLEVLDDAVDKAKSETRYGDQLDLWHSQIKTLMKGYAYYYPGDHKNWKTVAVEQEFYVPLINPYTGEPDSQYVQGGKVDGIIQPNVKNSKEYWLLEHKTTSMSIAEDSSYWADKAIDSQLSGYWNGCDYLGYPLTGVIYDVIKKPTISPKRLDKAAKQEIASGFYFGCEVDSGFATRDYESLALYEKRLFADVISDPGKYFVRKEFYRSPYQIDEFRKDIWQYKCAIANALTTGHHPKHSGACLNFNRKCFFFDLCSCETQAQFEDEWNEQWECTPARHNELDSEGAPEAQWVITNSRIKSFASCPRKHHYKYNLNAKHKKWADDGEALVFGSLMHKALERWWAPS